MVRCSVHERNQDALMGMALVYHETQQFVRLVQIMPLNHTIWQFLEPMQRSGAPLPRATLVQRCTSDQVCALQHALLRQFACGTPDFRHPRIYSVPDAASVVQAVLRFVADNARAAAAAGASSQLQVAFSAVLTAEVLQASPGRLSKDTVVRPRCPWLAVLLRVLFCARRAVQQLVGSLQSRVLHGAGAAAAECAHGVRQGRWHRHAGGCAHCAGTAGVPRHAVKCSAIRCSASEYFTRHR